MRLRMLPKELLKISCVAVTLAGCTAIQTREHTRESYRPPEDASVRAVRVFEEAPSRVFGALFDWLMSHSAEVEDADPEARWVVADLRFGSDDAQQQAVEMGSLRTVVTRTLRRYRTYWPFEAHCDECIIRRGNLISAETQLITDEITPLSAGAYQIAALLRAAVTESSEGARVELSVDFEVYPRSPAGVAPVSTGFLERAVFDALEQALAE